MQPKIQVDLWNGDPDIDAIARAVHSPEIEIIRKEPFCSNRMSPFDSQNTFLTREMIPFFMLMPGIGRVDDIWGSYWLQKKVKSIEPYVLYHTATVYQKRNPHDIVRDMELEIFGYRNALKFTTTDSLDSMFESVFELYQSYF